MRWSSNCRAKISSPMKLDGTLTQATIGGRFAMLAAEASKMAAPKEIDVSALSDFDSAGFACLTALKQIAGDARIVGASPRLRALASTYGATSLLG
ncbi:MAG: STAS domain-containing protein [Betaproteobacteria bacterium]|nr:MAG: STAS domain-containing protein [Betaproteobacteria bacterium]